MIIEENFMPKIKKEGIEGGKKEREGGREMEKERKEKER